MSKHVEARSLQRQVARSASTAMMVTVTIEVALGGNAVLACILFGLSALAWYLA